MGGKKKKVKKPDYKKPKYQVPDSWDCPLCSQKGTFHVKLFRTKGVAQAQCRACNQPNPAFEVTMTPLTGKVDVFLKFYDELVARDRAALEQMNVVVRPTEMMRARNNNNDGEYDPEDDDVMQMEFDNNEDDE